MKTELGLSRCLAAELVEALPLASDPSRRRIKSAIAFCRRTERSLMIVSSVCPAYSEDAKSRPDYRSLRTEISSNQRRHLKEIPKVAEILRRNGIATTHLFLMADTEVDLQSFLQQGLRIEPTEFTRRCQSNLEKISERLVKIYGLESYEKEGVTPASRFLEFFGEKNWYQRYEFYREKLLLERNNQESRVAVALGKDYNARSELVTRLLGQVDRDVGEEHIARQKAQYMAFSSLITDRFPGRVVVVNHRTPNFPWMNDFLRRDLDYSRRVDGVDDSLRQLELRYPRHRLPLLELNISTMPND